MRDKRDREFGEDDKKQAYMRFRPFGESLKEEIDSEDDWEDDEKYTLVGVDGNAFSVMGYTANALKREGLKDLIQQMRDEAMSSDYNNLLVVCMRYVDMANKAARGEL